MFQKLPDLIAGEIDDHGTDLGAIPDSDVLEGNSSRDGVHTMRWAIIVNEISFQIAFFLLELRSLCSKGPSTTAKDKRDDESQTISTGRLYTMCYLLHFKKGYNCQHEVLEQREKVWPYSSTHVSSKPLTYVLGRLWSKELRLKRSRS